MFDVVNGIRQVRPDHMVEVLVRGRWYLACECEWPDRRGMLGRPVYLGERVGVPAE